MGFRFWRRIRVAPGMTLNLSKTGGSLSFGVRGAHVTAGRRGMQGTVGIPGSGLFYTKQLGGRSAARKRAAGSGRDGKETSAGSDAPRDGNGRLADGAGEGTITRAHFRWKWLRGNESHLADAMVHWSAGREEQAIRSALTAPDLPDAQFLAGMLLLRADRYSEAEQAFRRVLESEGELGRWFDRMNLNLTLSFPVTEALFVDLPMAREGIQLALAEALQAQGDISGALAIVESLRVSHPTDPVIRISWADLLLDDAYSGTVTTTELEQAASMPALGDSRSLVDSVAVRLKAEAYYRLGVHTPPVRLLTGLLRRHHGMTEKLKKDVRYLRSKVYEARGDDRRSRQDLEEIYAMDPDYRDVRSRLGLA